MNVGDLRVNAFFGLERETYFTLDLGLARLGFLRVGRGFVLTGFVRSFEEGVVFASFSSSSYFWFTSCVIMYFIGFLFN
jgi:hypothetical protein